MSSQQQLSSRQLSHKPAENLFPRDVIAPDKPPRVRWHSQCHVKVFRNCGQLLLFVLFLITCFMFGPSLISLMYPHVMIPFNSKLGWTCSHISSYSQIKPSNLVLETNLMAAGSEMNIQIYMKDRTKTLDELQKILLVIDDCGFDDFGENVMLCRPISSFSSQFSFTESVRVAEICYNYLRQMTSKAEIAGYGKGIAANILIATAVTLREEYCYSFSKIFAEEPIPDIKNEFEKSYWIGTAFMLPVFRERMVQRTIKEFGLDKADIGENVQNVNTSIIIFTEGDYDTLYGSYGDYAQSGRKKLIFDYMNPKATVPSSVPKKNKKKPSNDYQFRHPQEGECARKKNLPITSVMIF